MRHFTVALLAAALCTPAWADSEAHDRDSEFCKKNPVTCEVAEDRKAAREKFCKDNPQKCEALKAEREARREKRQARREAMREKCEASPEECKKGLEKRRERRRERVEGAGDA